MLFISDSCHGRNDGGDDVRNRSGGTAATEGLVHASVGQKLVKGNKTCKTLKFLSVTDFKIF
jgi:hypothetical protein